MDHYQSMESVNLGTGNEISVRDLASMIAELTGYDGEIEWDTSKPDGMPRKCMDVSRLHEIGFRAQISLEQGIKETIKEYRRLKSRMNVYVNNESSRKLGCVLV